MPFESIGEKARWRVVYEKLITMSVGDVLTYDRMADLLDLDPRDDRHSMQMAVRRAAQQFLQDDSRALEAVRGIGYEIVAPEDQLRLAKQHNVRAGTQIAMAQALVVCVDLSEVQQAVRDGFEMMALGFSQQDEINRAQQRKNTAMMRALSTASTKQERTQEEVDLLQNRLAQLEKKLGPT